MLFSLPGQLFPQLPPCLIFAYSSQENSACAFITPLDWAGTFIFTLKSILDYWYMLCGITVKNTHTLMIANWCLFLLHSRMTFCSSSTKLTAEAHIKHVCRTNEQSGWRILLVIILLNKKATERPICYLLREPLPRSPRELWLPWAPLHFYIPLLEHGIRCTIILYITKTFFKMLPIIINICIHFSKMSKCNPLQGQRWTFVFQH